MIPTEGLAVVASRPRRGPLGLLSRPRPGPLGFNRLVADLSPIASLTSPGFRVRSVSRWTTRPQLRPRLGSANWRVPSNVNRLVCPSRLFGRRTGTTASDLAALTGDLVLAILPAFFPFFFAPKP